MSDINTDAREEVANYWQAFFIAALPHENRLELSRSLAEAVIDSAPLLIPRLAGLLGYVKADGTRTAYGVRRAGVVYPNVFGSAQQAVEWSLGFTDNGVGCEIVRRHVSAWEVVVDASE